MSAGDRRWCEAAQEELFQSTNSLFVWKKGQNTRQDINLIEGTKPGTCLLFEAATLGATTWSTTYFNPEGFLGSRKCFILMPFYILTDLLNCLPFVMLGRVGWEQGDKAVSSEHGQVKHISGCPFGEFLVTQLLEWMVGKTQVAPVGLWFKSEPVSRPRDRTWTCVE